MTSRIEGRYAIEWPADGDSCRVLAIGDSTLTAEGPADARQLWLQRALDSIHLATGRSLHLVVRATPGARLRQQTPRPPRRRSDAGPSGPAPSTAVASRPSTPLRCWRAAPARPGA